VTIDTEQLDISKTVRSFSNFILAVKQL